MTRKIPTRTEMQEHIVVLCERNEILIQWCLNPNQAWAMRQWDEIKIPQIKSEISYAVGLHEIGHVLGQHQTSKRVLVRERWAWVVGPQERANLERSYGAARPLPPWTGTFHALSVSTLVGSLTLFHTDGHTILNRL